MHIFSNLSNLKGVINTYLLIKYVFCLAYKQFHFPHSYCTCGGYRVYISPISRNLQEYLVASFAYHCVSLSVL